MPALVPWFLLLHVGAAIVAFGPSFVFPVLGAAGGREPMHGNFALRMNALIEDRFIIPVGLTMPITGVLLIWSAGFDFFTAHWLDVAIVVYIAAMSYAIFVQRGIVIRMIELTGGHPAPGAAPGMARAEGPGADTAQPPAGAPPAGGPPAGGPPPEFLALVKRSQQGGMFLTICLVIIVILMVVKPTF